MANKDEEFKPTDLASDFANLKSDDTSWIIGLALIAGIFSDNTIWKKKDDTETRLAKLETKTEMLEKIILK